MATPLSIYNLKEGGWRTVLSISGISIAVTLIFMQLGFLGAVLDTAVLFYNNLKFDLIVRSPNYYHFCDANKFSTSYLDPILSNSAVDSIQHFDVSIGKWNYAETSTQRGILIMGVDPIGETFASRGGRHQLPNLSQLDRPHAILVDKKSRPKFLGADNREPFNDQQIGLQIELNQKTCEIRGLFELGTGLAANGASVIREDDFRNLFPNFNDDDVSIGLIQLSEKAAADPKAARDKIIRSLSGTEGNANEKIRQLPVDVLTREEVVGREIRHWIGNTPIGFIFIAGVVVALIVGAIVVYIVLSSDISKQIGEYATTPKRWGTATAIYPGSCLNRQLF